MKDYLETYKKFKDCKEVFDLVHEVEELRRLYLSQQFEEMQEHINELTKKYLVETFAWNCVNPIQPITYQQAYLNAENFLMAQGAKKIVELFANYKDKLSSEEIDFIESISKTY